MPKDLPTKTGMTMICITPCWPLQKWGGLAQHNLATQLEDKDEDKAKAKDIAKAKDNDDDEGPHVCACRRGVA